MTRVVGITGGIGSGKSAVTDRLADHGVTIIDADIAARTVVQPGSAGLQAIIARHGDSILLPDGTLDRAGLRAIVFAAPDERRWLESVTHPLIRTEIERQISAASSPYAVLSSPLLIESKQAALTDYVIVVDVPESVQLQRAMTRDNNDETLIRNIMAAQLDRQQRLDAADEIIDNSGSLAVLNERVDKLHGELLARFGD